MRSIRLRWVFIMAICAGAFPVHADDAIDAAIDRMSDDEKVAQLLMVGFDGTKVSPELRRLVAEWRVGGVVLYRQNIESAVQAAKLNAEIRKLAAGHSEPFIAVDQEGGLVQRLHDGVPDLPGNMALGATRSPQLARRAGRALGQSLRALGFTMNFAPVLDVLSNPENSSLLTRAFSDDPQLVASLGKAFIEGESESGIIAVAKHFPGEGGTAGDSHFGLPVLDADRHTLDTRELVPFRAAIAAHVPAIMTAHVALPRIAESPDLPATLSCRVLTDLLRHDLRFEGLVITDELQMRSIRDHGSIGDVAVDALLAGADMIMVVWDHRDRDEIYESLRKAYASGKLPHARVRQSLRRILAAKQRVVTPRWIEDPTIAADIARASIAIIRHGSGPLLKPGGAMAVLGPDGPLRRRFPEAIVNPTPPRVDDHIVESAVAACRGVDTILAIIGSENDRLLTIAVHKRLPAARLIVVALGSPSELRGIRGSEAIVFAWSSSEVAQNAAASALFREAPAPGIVPVHGQRR